MYTAEELLDGRGYFVVEQAYLLGLKRRIAELDGILDELEEGAPERGEICEELAAVQDAIRTCQAASPYSPTQK